MPSNVVQSLLKKIAPALQGMPALTVSYDGQQDPTLDTRLETFLAQARMFQRAVGEPPGVSPRVSPRIDVPASKEPVG